MAHDASQADYEETYVHQVYDEIASHFSSTRFKPWPVVDEFLKMLPSYAVGLDIGCGNGKYLTVRKDLFIIASDRSPELLKFAAQHQPHSAVVSDVLNLAHPASRFDFAICIAVIHHLSTPQRRQDALRAILDTLRPGSDATRDLVDASGGESDGGDNPSADQVGRFHGETSPGQALVFVWALEQKSSRRGWDAGMDQDVLVPWVLKAEHDRNGRNKITTAASVAATTTNTDANDTLVGAASAGDQPALDGGQASNRTERTFHRYYHLYRKGELEEDIAAVGGKVVKNGYDRDNWWAIFERDVKAQR